MSLLSAILFLNPTSAGESRGSLGRAAHAWLLDRVLAYDHRLATALHEPNQERPFTVSDVLRQGVGVGRAARARVFMGGWLVAGSRPCWMGSSGGVDSGA